MGQKVNPNSFNLIEKNTKQSNYFEKKTIEQSVYSKTDLEVKNFIRDYFGKYKIFINNCKLIYLNNLLYIYLSYYKKLKKSYSKNRKIRILNNCFNLKKSVINKQFKNTTNKKSFLKNLKLIKTYKLKNLKKQFYRKTNKNNLENNLFLETFFISLQKFIFKEFNIFLMLERQNKKIIVFKKKKSFSIKRKQKFITLRKYKQNKFFKKGINVLLSSIWNKNSSKLIAQYIATQMKTLKHHNFFIRFIKDVLIILNNKIFFSKTKGIKIKVKGRFNGRPRAQSRIIQISSIPPTLTKNININYFEKVAFSKNGTFGIKVWEYK